jgi:UPF0271 protein
MIDLNCDMGESFGVYNLGRDEEMMQYITSANIACGFHAGDPAVMERTLRLAKDAGVAAGAHISYPDLQGFGRRYMELPQRELRQLTLYQLGALQGIARSMDLDLQHIKAHGALYNRAETDTGVAEAVVDAAAAFDEGLLVFAKPDSAMAEVAQKMGLRVAAEAFADRAYDEDGNLASRGLEGAVLHDPDQISERVLRLVQTNSLETLAGSELNIEAHTICVHGDTPGAVEIVKKLHSELTGNGVEVVRAAAVLDSA